MWHSRLRGSKPTLPCKTTRDLREKSAYEQMELLDGKGPQYERQHRPIPTELYADLHDEPSN